MILACFGPIKEYLSDKRALYANIKIYSLRVLKLTGKDKLWQTIFLKREYFYLDSLVMVSD
ncbi:MAG: hypothetical protein CVU13_03115 [Bacteroidetes bacterium HGW-Bacteroidetes-8]|nr:MAG: hypothetical protein CVU13_03115 [Bacteroidetes bacterium HGW-Bacteroidetes-8]